MPFNEMLHILLDKILNVTLILQITVAPETVIKSDRNEVMENENVTLKQCQFHVFAM